MTVGIAVGGADRVAGAEVADGCGVTGVEVAPAVGNAPRGGTVSVGRRIEAAVAATVGLGGKVYCASTAGPTTTGARVTSVVEEGCSTSAANVGTEDVSGVGVT